MQVIRYTGTAHRTIHSLSQLLLVPARLCSPQTDGISGME
jgi:hypothetical protein